MTAHVAPPALAAYAAGTLGPDHAATWALEVHLEGCAQCRARLAELAGAPLQRLLDDTRTAILAQARSGPRPVPPRRWRWWQLRWADWSLFGWMAMTFTAILAAVLLDVGYPDRPSTVLLLAPVAPLAGLGVSWSRRANPDWEMIAGTARAGLEMLLRRTIAVLVFVLPPLAVAGLVLGRNPALWLLPCLTFTAATLLLGSRIGVPLAAAVLGGGWLAAAGAVTGIAAAPVEGLMRAQTMPAWAAAAAVLALLTVLRADHLRSPATWR
ncbi:zf-HC2 domain-containing protein [Dactylosporangium vinaceum]|uniref:Zf-HC2 domain-containing protein n=1 Tax=Dactylosporangium vinaceum TaxID=53362 RepID=A0ABV5MF43_9ACTN|nr:zf-HC2 domain-containing protein [Dactylosporangium vinaceum]UAB96996.1 zf-HC2 domain-containing protein [Dactylosporangium vinaceum]